MNGRVRILVEGITEAGAAVDAAHLGCDGVVFDFRRESPRALDPSEAREIGRRLPPLVARVGRFGAVPAIRILEVAREAGLTALLFDDALPLATEALASWPALASVPFEPGFDPSSLREIGCTSFVLRPRGWEGTRPDWGKARSASLYGRLLLASVRPEEAEWVVDRVRPYGLCCGEAYEFEPGRLDRERLEDLVLALRRAEQRPARAGTPG